jgi:hypothetical protein
MGTSVRPWMVAVLYAAPDPAHKAAADKAFSAEGPSGRGLHSSTFRINVSVSSGI